MALIVTILVLREEVRRQLRTMKHLSRWFLLITVVRERCRLVSTSRHQKVKLTCYKNSISKSKTASLVENDFLFLFMTGNQSVASHGHLASHTSWPRQSSCLIISQMLCYHRWKIQAISTARKIGSRFVAPYQRSKLYLTDVDSSDRMLRTPRRSPSNRCIHLLLLCALGTRCQHRWYHQLWCRGVPHPIPLIICNHTRGNKKHSKMMNMKMLESRLVRLRSRRLTHGKFDF